MGSLVPERHRDPQMMPAKPPEKSAAACWDPPASVPQDALPDPDVTSYHLSQSQRENSHVEVLVPDVTSYHLSHSSVVVLLMNSA